MSTIKFGQVTNDLSPADLKSKSEGGTYLSEGRYAVKVVEIAEPQPNKFDANWVDIDITVQAENGKTARATLAVPVAKTLQYQTSKGPSSYRARELLNFCEAAWGDTEFPKEVTVYLRKRFGVPDSTLKSLKFEVTIAHPFGRVYAKRVGGAIKLFKDDKPLDGEFADFKGAEAHATQQGLKYSKFAKVTKFHPLTKAPAAIDATSDADDLPF